MTRIANFSLVLCCFLQLLASAFFYLFPSQKIKDLIVKKEEVDRKLNEAAMNQYLKALEAFAEAGYAFSIVIVNLALVQILLVFFVRYTYRKNDASLQACNENTVSEFFKAL